MKYVLYVPESGLILYPDYIDHVWAMPMNEVSEAAANMGTFLADNQPTSPAELLMLGGIELTNETLEGVHDGLQRG